jgi:pimeloyl-ACP methyl ester carboxylesterase
VRSNQRVFHLERPGGRLEVHDLTAGGHPDDGRPVVIALHGLTGNGLCWAGVADAMSRRMGPEVPRVLAPDLRGRAGSRAVSGPWGLDEHVADVLALADAVGATSFTLLGWSMGAFVAALVASRHPERVDRLVLADGGVAVPVPEQLDPEAVLRTFVGPSLERLSLRFPDVESYLSHWFAQAEVRPAALDQAGRAVLERYMRHDLVVREDAWVTSCVPDAVMADGRDIVTSLEVRGAVAAVAGAGVPVELVWADSQGLVGVSDLYDAERLSAQGLPAGVRLTAVPGATHVSLTLTAPGVRALADALQRTAVPQPA